MVLGAVLPVFCIMGAGAAVRRLEWLTAEADRALLQLTINLLAPCLILDSILGNAALRQWQNLLVPPLVGFGTVVAGIALAWWVRHRAGLANEREQRTFALATGMYNYGYVPIPLVLMLFADSPQGTLGVLFVHNVGTELALWTVGLVVLTGASPGREWRRIINAPVMSIILGLALNLTGAYRWMPDFVLTTARMLGQCAIPLGILLIGATMADHIGDFHSRSAGRVMGAATLLRIGVLPVGFLALACYLPASIELQRVIVLQAAMPAAVFPIVMARHFNGDAPTALRVVIATSVVSLISTPLWIRVGLSWIGD